MKMEGSDFNDAEARMAADLSDLDDSMRTCLFCFEDAIRDVANSFDVLFNEYGGHLGVSWEVRQEILIGKSLLEWRGVSPERRDKIRDIAKFAEKMPSDAYACAGINDFSHPAWEGIQQLAREFVAMPRTLPPETRDS
ncbi:hypothetical protein RZA67_00400 [Stenotrophomonas sp. C3(2023)]|uniref:hypothetical protein n=1 Tax=Stenotrophomonas sp. C3(2023) TaxID=3080277 RepID=UPI00293D1678|nr:hypothetical protein [Stenotrophomonas sp. C3(2023)]MDV3467197.1 hypothetical protein [Stenotrophomonas sp. C3(2023)]